MSSTNFNKKISNIVNGNFDHILVNQHVGNIITHLSPHIKSKKLENSANLSFLFNKKFNNHQLHEPLIEKTDLVPIKESIESGFVSSVGKHIELFKRKIQDLTKCKNIVLCRW